MRETLTILAVLLILVLSAALAVPYFVNWDAERGLVEAQLSNVLGRPVKVRGAINLKLLPTPYLRLANVQLGGPAAPPEIKVDEIQLEIALPPLLRGEVDFVEAKLVRPHVALKIMDGALPLGPPLRHFSGPMRFERISVGNGTLALSDPTTGRSYRFTNISLSAQAVSLAGPFKGEGRLVFAGQQTAFRFSTGAQQGNALPFKLIVDENKQHPRADIEASLNFIRSQTGFALPLVAGKLKLAGHLEGKILMPWRLEGTLQAQLRKATLRDLDLHLGDEEHAVSFAGSADFDLGATPRANATLKAHQIDLDRLLSPIGAPAAMQRLTHAASALLDSEDLMISGVPLALAWSADTAILGGETLSGLSGGFAVSDKAAAWVRFQADGPGGSHLLLDGDVETGSAAGFKGRFEASAGDVPRLTKWLSAHLPQSAHLFAELPIHAFDATGKANISEVGFVGRDLSLRLDRSRLSGTLAYTRSVSGEPARLFADLSTSRLDFDKMPNLSDFADRAKAMDLSLRLDARAVKVSSFGQSSLNAGAIELKLQKTGKFTKLDRLTLARLGGANITAHGQWDGSSGEIAGTIDSKSLGEAAALLRRLAPSPATDALLARAADLSPTHLGLSAQARMNAQGGYALDRLDLAGTAGGTKITAKIAADPQNPAELMIASTLEAPDALDLLRQIGLSPLPLPEFGAGRVEIKAHGRLDKPFDADVTASLAGTSFAFQGRVAPELAAPHVSGTLKLASINLTPMLEATGLAFPGPSTRLPADFRANIDAQPTRFTLRDLSGDFAGTKIAGKLGYDNGKGLTGALAADRLSLATIFELALGELSRPPPESALWSNAKFSAAMINPPPTHLTVTAKSFDLWTQMSGRDAQLGIDISGGRAGLELALRDISMKLGAGSVAGNLTLRRNGATAAATGHLKLSDYDLVLPSARGKLSGDLDLAGTGDSASAIVAGLAGLGTLTFGDLVLPRTDPAAIGLVFKAVEDDQLGLDGREIDRALASELDKGASHLGKVAFDAGLAAGVVRLTPKQTGARIPAPGVTAALQASFDLGNLSLDQRTDLSLRTLPKNWNGPAPQITLISEGPVSNPVRTIESSGFVNALAARAIARESARIQTQEFEIHEQAFFYNRLKSERRREQEKLQAEEDAKRAQAAQEKAAQDKAARTEANKVEAQKVEAEKIERTKAKAEAAKRRAQQRAPLSIIRQPPPAPAPLFHAPIAVDPLAAGRY